MITLIHISEARKYKPGDPPPSGYLQWHEWADIQYKSGLRQQECGICGKWKFPQELSGKTIVSELRGNKGTVTKKYQVCKECDKKRK